MFWNNNALLKDNLILVFSQQLNRNDKSHEHVVLALRADLLIVAPTYGKDNVIFFNFTDSKRELRYLVIIFSLSLVNF